jgi:hypothetical protein
MRLQVLPPDSASRRPAKVGSSSGERWAHRLSQVEDLRGREEPVRVAVLTHIIWRLCTSPYQAVFLDCTSLVLGVKNYLTELSHAPLAGICLPNFSLSSCYRQILFVLLTCHSEAPSVTCTCIMSQNPQDNQSYPLRLPNYRFLHQGRYHPYPTFNRQQGASSSETGDVEIAVCLSC